MTSTKPPRIYTEERPNGSVRAGFRIRGAKIQRTFEYAYEAEAWAEEARSRALAALALGLDPVAAATGETATAGTPASARSSSSSPRFDEYAERWLRVRKGSIGATTWDGYRIHVDGILADVGDLDHRAIRSLRLDEITKGDVEAWRSRARAAGANPPTLNARLKVMRAVLNYAVAERKLDADPTRGLAFLKYDPTRIKAPVTAEDERRLLAASDDDERLLILLGLDAGLRYQEAAAITADDRYVDDNGDRFLYVAHTIERKTGRRVRDTKAHRNRSVPETPRLTAALDRAELAAKPGTTLVAREDGSPWSYDYHRHAHWRGLTHRAGLKTRGGARRGFHELRHTYATRLHRAGVAMVDISELLGHADVETTETYLHGTTPTTRHRAVTAALAAAV